MNASSMWRPAARTALLMGTVLIVAVCAGLPEPAAPRQAPVAADAHATARSFAAPSGDWPQDTWWRAYGDPQLDALIGEAFAGAPSVAVADARLRQAQAFVQVTRGQAAPQVGASVSATQQRHSANHLTPSSATPDGWNDFGRATLDFSWEIDFWGRHRAALAAATSEAGAARADARSGRVAGGALSKI